jgi:outer membrane immunogenic protein
MKFRALHAALILAATPVQAADLALRRPPPAPAPPPIFLFGGFYAGAQLGALSLLDRTQTLFAPTGAELVKTTARATHVAGGLHAGYDWRWGGLVYGLRAEASGARVKGAALDPFTAQYATTVDAQGALLGRVGYAFDRLLIYAAGGLNVAHVRHEYQTPAAFAGYDHIVLSPTVGLGVEYAFNDRWLAHVDYRVAGVGTGRENGLLLRPLAAARHDAGTGAISVGLSYRFGQ